MDELMNWEPIVYSESTGNPDSSLGAVPGSPANPESTVGAVPELIENPGPDALPKPTENQEAPTNAVPESATKPDDQPQSASADANVTLKEVFERGMKGDLTVLPLLKKAFEKHPEFIAQFGDMAAVAEQSLAALLFDNHITRRQANEFYVAERKQQLYAECRSDLERLLVDTLVLAEMEVQVVVAQGCKRAELGPLTSREMETQQQYHSQAMRRFLGVAKQLAEVRRILQPAKSPLELLNGSTRGSTAQSHGQRLPTGERFAKNGKAFSDPQTVPVAN